MPLSLMLALLLKFLLALPWIVLASLYSQGEGTFDLDSISWKNIVAKVEKGWITVKGRKYKSPQPSFDIPTRERQKVTL